MKYLVLKIIGILGLVVTPIIMNGSYGYVEDFGSILARKSWFEAYELLLIVFLVITMAGFARSIAKMKATFDFYTDFDDDQHLDFYPKIKVYSFVKKIMTILAVVAIIVLSILREDIAAIDKNYNCIMLVITGVVFALYLASIITCLVAKVAPLYYDRAVVLIIIGIAIEEVMMYFGCKWIIAMMIPSPIYAFAILYLASALDDFISIEEVFDWICDDEYNKHYKKLCDREKEKEEKKELSEHRQNKKAKIETKQTVRAEKKKVKQEQKEEKKSSKKKISE